VSESGIYTSATPEETFAIGERLAAELQAGDVVLLKGGLGAGKTLLTKGIVGSLGFDVDDVTSPSFALVNLYRTDRFDVYHIDLWRVESDAAFAVGLDDILEEKKAVVIIEWAERLSADRFFDRRVFEINISGDGDEPRAASVRVSAGGAQN
jgi:tRNA threonylcarbamoyladenosine biosynthesis protein TsaE